MIASCSRDGTIRLWNSVTGEPLVRLLCAAMGLHFSPDDGELMATEENGGHVLIDVATGRERRSLLAPVGNRARAIAFSSDGNLMACGGDRGVRFWNFTDTLVNPPPVDVDLVPYSRSVAFSPDSSCLVASAGSGIWRVPLMA